MNSKSSLLASPLAAGAATVTRTSSALTPDENNVIQYEGNSHYTHSLFTKQMQRKYKYISSQKTTFSKKHKAKKKTC